MAKYRISLVAFLACWIGSQAFLGWAHAQHVYEPGTAGTNWTRNNAWRIDGNLTGSNYPNGIDVTAVFNLPLSAAANYTVGFNGAPAITLGSLYVNNLEGHNFATNFGGSSVPGSLTFQTSSVDAPAVYYESAGTGNAGTTVNSLITLLSDLRVTQEHFVSATGGGFTNGATTFSNKINAAAGLTFYKAGNSNLNASFNGGLESGEGFFGSYVIEQGAMRFVSNALLMNAEGFTVQAGGQLQIGGSPTDLNLGSGATLKLNGGGVIGGPTNNDGSLRFQLNDGVTTSFNSPIELQSAATITVQNSAANAAVNLTKAVSGAGGLTKNGNGDLYLVGDESNTHAGGTGVANGRLFLNKTGSAVAVPGTLNIGGTSIVVLQRNHQIADDSLIRFTSTTAQGILRLGANRQETVGGLLSTNPNAGIIESNSNQTSTSTLEINATHQSRFEGLIRDAANTVNQPGKLAIVKSGAESLELTGANTYSGGTVVSGGSLLVNNISGSGVGTGDLMVNNGGIIGGRGIIGTGAAPVAVNVVGGVIAPGDTTPGVLTMHGNVTLDVASSITFDLAGANAGLEYDQVVVHNDLNLGGATLDFTLGSFVPTGVESFTLISKESEGSINGVFSNYGEGAAVSLAGVSYKLSYSGGSGNDVVLTLNPNQPTLNADFNGDGIVDGSDFLVWQRGYGGPGGLLQGDANGDNMVNGEDLAVWKDQFGAPGPGAQASVATIPEPAGLMLFATALGGLFIARRRVEGIL